MHWLLVVIALSGPVLPPVVTFSTAAFATESECEGAKRALLEALAEAEVAPRGHLELACKSIDAPPPAQPKAATPSNFKLEHNA